MVERAIDLRPPPRARSVLLICLGVSVSLHAAVLALLPALAPDDAPPGASRLEVVILQPTPLPVTASAPAPILSASSKPEPQRARAAAEEKPRPEQTAPVLSQPPTNEQRSFSVAAGYREPEVAGPEQRPEVASAAVMPPSHKAAYLSNSAPRYPVAARRAGEQGTVTLRVRVAVDGSASRVAVEKSSGSPHLDAAALEAVKAWRFTPARQGANSVESWMLVPIVFRLEGSS